MSNIDKESLSALIDNEADDLELRRLLQTIESDSELKSTWERMNLVQAVLHDDNVQHSTSIHLFGDNFADKVASAIAGETIAPAKPELKSSWGKSFAQLGIAASVALAFFLGMQTIMPQQEQSGTAPVAQQSDTSNSQSLTGVAQTEETLVTEPAIQQVDPEARQRLEDYIRSVSIRPEEPAQLESLQDSPLYRLVNEIQNSQ